MNERIRELFEKAGANANTVAVLKQHTYFDPELFAELIVRECMNAVGDDPMAQPYLQRIKAKFGVEYYEPIEKAFGVEE